jgi:hypothetical protein
VSGYDYLRDDLQARVSHRGGVSDTLDTAAGRAAGAPPDAYGLIDSFIPALLPVGLRHPRTARWSRSTVWPT